jgi:CheY-like chemotaxis protein
MKTFSILLAEDDEEDIEIFKQFLAELYPDISLDVVENGNLVLDHLNKIETLPDAIFLDLNMPKKNGLDCLREIKKYDRFKMIKTIILTTSSDIAQKNSCYAEGADLYITKPSNYTHFKSTFSAAIDKITR